MAFASSSRETRSTDLNSLLVIEAKRPRRGMQDVEQNMHFPTDAFKRHFVIASVTFNLLFDFESFDDENRVSTLKRILLNSVLHLRSRNSCREA